MPEAKSCQATDVSETRTFGSVDARAEQATDRILTDLLLSREGVGWGGGVLPQRFFARFSLRTGKKSHHTFNPESDVCFARFQKAVRQDQTGQIGHSLMMFIATSLLKDQSTHLATLTD